MPGAFLWGYVAIEGDKRNQGGEADTSGVVDLSQSFAPANEVRGAEQRKSDSEVVAQMKEDLSLISESLATIRDRFKMVNSSVMMYHPEQETESQSSPATAKTTGSMLTELLMEAMTELVKGSVDKSGMVELYQAVEGLEHAIQSLDHVQKLAETLLAEGGDRKTDELAELFKNAIVSPDDLLPTNSPVGSIYYGLTKKGISPNYGTVVQYTRDQIKAIVAKRQDTFRVPLDALEQHLKLVGLTLKEQV